MNTAITHPLTAAVTLAAALVASGVARAAPPLGAPRVPDAALCNKPHPAGMTTRSLRVEGQDRQYVLLVPSGYDGSTPMPAVFDIHGSGSNPEEERLISGMAIEAEQSGFVLIMPVAAVDFPPGGHTWNVPVDNALPSDVEFVRAALRDVSARVCVDPGRVYAAGFSGGARLASQLACELSDRIAAIGAVGGLRCPEGCAPRRPVPVIAFHGTADPINPYPGGGPSYWQSGVDHALRAWVERNGCRGQPVRDRVSTSVSRYTFPGCGAAAEVVFYRLEGAGHIWPGSGFDFPGDRFGPMNREISATREMLDFFRRHAIR
jgi:polyhydroxybutyrate depolymerase